MDIAIDPVERLAAWLAEAMRLPGRNHDAMAIATASASGVPDVRYVLLKRVDAHGLAFFTNRDSAKGRQLMANPAAAAALYWPGLDRQVRARGPVVEQDRARVAEYFATRSRASQLGAWASSQSSTLDGMDELRARQRQVEERFAATDVPLPEHWTGYCLRPLAIEFWQEGASRLHERVVHERADIDGAWTVRRLFP